MTKVPTATEFDHECNREFLTQEQEKYVHLRLNDLSVGFSKRLCRKVYNMTNYYPTVLVIVQKAREMSTNIPRYCTVCYCTVGYCTVPCACSSCYSNL